MRSAGTLEEPIERRWTQSYLASKARLDPELQLSLDLAEESILADPDRESRRFIRSDDAVVDFANPGLLIAFRRVRSTLIEFVEFEVL